MSRIVNILFALVLIVALVIALDPDARQRAAETVRAWEPTLRQLNSRVVVNVPSVSVPARPATPVPTATVVAVSENDEQIPVTGDTENRPFIQVNWDVLGDALREFWISLTRVKIELTPPR